MNSRRNRYIFLSMLIFCVINGCATPKAWIPITGSRADGTIKLAFEYGGFEKPEIQPGQAQHVAAQKCIAWGYSGAEAFGGIMQQCIMRNQYGCIRQRVFADFQCTGRP